MAEKPSRGLNKDGWSGNVRRQRGQLQRSEEAKEETKKKRAKSLGSIKKRTYDEMVQEGAEMETPLFPPIENDYFDEMLMGTTEQEASYMNTSEAQGSQITSSSTISMDEVREWINEVLKYCEGFNVILSSTNVVERQTICSVPRDDGLALVSCSHCRIDLDNLEGVNRQFDFAMTKGSFSRALYTIFQKHGMDKSTQKEIIELLRSSLPYSIRFPAPTTIKSHHSVIEHGIADYADYAAPDFLTFEACVQGCCVFVGDNATLMRCPSCKLPRYMPCGNCRAVEGCVHVKRRTAYRTLNYRPIIGLFTRLLVRYPEFYKLCTFNNNNIIDDNQDYILDFMQGAVARKQQAAMDKVYEDAVKEQKIDQSYMKINLLLAEFYDGIQVYSTKTVPCEPLLLQILNLPPNLRGTIGVGVFIVSIIALTRLSNNCEQFIYRDCLIKELEKLSEGIPIVSNDGRKYFLQARMVMHCLDTPAMCHLLRMKGKGSYEGCPLCRCFRATRRADIKKVALYDHRRLLEYEHVLRFYGQSQKCCPAGYYCMDKVPAPDHNQQTVWESFDNRPLTIDFGENNVHAEEFFKSWCLKDSATVPQKTMENVMKFLRTPQGRKEFICYHNEFNVAQFDSLFGDYLYFAHCNYMEKVNYGRVPGEQYLREAAEKAEKTRREAAEKAEKARNVHQVKGVDAEKAEKDARNVQHESLWDFARLRYADLQKHVCWDPFHVFKCIYENFSENLVGARVSAGRSEWCKSTGCHPSLWKPATFDKNRTAIYRPAYVLSPEDQKVADACMNCLVFPVGHKKSYAITNPFSRSGNLMGHGKLAVLSVFMDYMLRLTKLPIQYKNAFALFSQDISLLLSPVIKRDSVEMLWRRVLESIVIMEGFFPESEAMFPRHQLLDLPKQLLEFGPVRGWWTLFGERSLSHIKKYIPRGGRAFYKTVYEQYIVSEATETEVFYKSAAEQPSAAGEEKDANDDDSNDERVDDNNGEEKEDHEQQEDNDGEEPYNKRVQERPVNLNEVECLDSIDGRYCYDAFGTNFSDAMIPEDASVTQYDLEGIVECLIREIERRTSSFKHALHQSPFFYLLHFYGRHVLQYKNSYVIGHFIVWLKNDVEEWVNNNKDQIFTMRMSEQTEEVIYESFSTGKIYAECLAAGQEFFGLNVEMYSKADILGVAFRARGWECRESDPPDQDETQNWGAQHQKYQPSNKLKSNRLKQKWHQKMQYSSWCRVSTWKVSNANIITAKRPDAKNIFGLYYHNQGFDWKKDGTSLYGQLNAFLVFKVPSDTVLNNMGIVLITCRKFKTSEVINRGKLTKLGGNVAIVDAVDAESFEKDVCFLPVTHIIPSVVALAGFHVGEDGQHKPVQLRKRGGDKDDKNYCLNFSDESQISYLTLVDVDRNSADAVFEYVRLNFGYENHEVVATGQLANATQLQFKNV